MKQFPTHIVAVDGIVKNNNGEILLVRQVDGGHYAIPGGQVEVGENLIDALAREIKEETGYDVAVDKLICVSSNTAVNEGRHGYAIVPTKVIFGFTCTLLGGEAATSDETSEVVWIPKAQVLDYITNAALRKRFESYLSFNSHDIQYLEYVTRPYELKLERSI